MTPTRKLLLLVAAGLAPLTLAGLAAAVEGGDDATQTEVTAAEATAADATAATPDATCPDDAADQSSDDEATEVDATEVDATEVDATEVDATEDAATEDAATEDESAEADDCEAPGVEDSAPAPADEPVADAGTHPENHGFFVSEAAKSCPAGPEHGPCVRAVAQSDAGKPDHGTDTTADDATTATDTSAAALEGGDAPANHGHSGGASKGKRPKH